jgi:DNA-binding MarR family transcriptional regulator
MQHAIADPGPGPNLEPFVDATSSEAPEPSHELVVAILDVVTRVRRRHGSVASLDKGAVSLLSQLSESGEVRGSDLAQHACLDASTVSRHLRALEAAGYVTRRTDPADARAALIDLSAAGHDILASALADRANTFARATASWNTEDKAALTRLVRRLADDLETL